jgi:hypothetical protein
VSAPGAGSTADSALLVIRLLRGADGLVLARVRCLVDPERGEEEVFTTTDDAELLRFVGVWIGRAFAALR